jgi:hypothetical protein
MTEPTVINCSRCAGSAWRSRGSSNNGARGRASAAGVLAADELDLEGRGAGLDIPLSTVTRGDSRAEKRRGM